MATRNLVIRFLGDDSRLQKALTRTRVGLRALRTGLRHLAVGAGIATAAGLAVGAVFVSMANRARHAIDAMAKLAQNLAITNSEAQQLSLVADLSGVSMQNLTNAMFRTNRMLGDARKGSKSAAELFDRLGLSVDNLATLDGVARFRRVIDALRDIENPVDRASIAAGLFERQWRTLGPLIESSSDAFERAKSVFVDLGLGLTKEGGEAVQLLNDEISHLVDIMNGAFLKVFEKIVPKMQPWVKALRQVAENYILAAGGGDKFAESLATLVSDRIPKMFEGLGKLALALEGIATVFGAVFDTIVGVAKIGAGLAAVGNRVAQGDFAGAQVAGEAALKDLFNVTDEELPEQTGLLRNILTEIGRPTPAVAQ